MTRVEEFTGDDVSELTPVVSGFAGGENVDIGVIIEDDEIIGGSVVANEEGYSVMEYMEIKPEYRGRKVDGTSLARALTEYTLDFLPDDRTLHSVATSLDGKTQHIRQSEGFEVSGLSLDKNRSGVKENPSGGFEISLWRLGEDEHLQAYVPEEIRDFVDKSLSDQRDITYLQPESTYRFGASIDELDVSERKFEADVVSGEDSLTEITSGLQDLRSINNWAEVANMDVSEPFTYDLSSELWGQGYRPVDMSPAVTGNNLKMAKIHREVGEYDLTPETVDLVDETGLDYRVVDEDELSSTVVFEP